MHFVAIRHLRVRDVTGTHRPHAAVGGPERTRVCQPPTNTFNAASNAPGVLLALE
jgi:hypothetical protein